MTREQAKYTLEHITSRTPNYRVREALHAVTGVITTPEVAKAFAEVACAGEVAVNTAARWVHAQDDATRVEVSGGLTLYGGAVIERYAEEEFYSAREMARESLLRGYHYYADDGEVYIVFPRRPRRAARRLFFAEATEAWDASGSGAFTVAAPTAHTESGLPCRFDVMRVEADGTAEVWRGVSPADADEALRRAEPDARKWYTPQTGGSRRVRNVRAGEMLRADDYAVERLYPAEAARVAQNVVAYALRDRDRVAGYTVSHVIAARVLRYAFPDARRWKLVRA